MRMPGFTAETALYSANSHYCVSRCWGNPSPTAAVLPQLANRDYTTRDVCKACGCTATLTACDCGPRGPNDKQRECLDNGGPVKGLFVRRNLLSTGGALGRF
jgi:hypothetical protein